jgi:hypothetical protein
MKSAFERKTFSEHLAELYNLDYNGPMEENNRETHKNIPTLAVDDVRYNLHIGVKDANSHVDLLFLENRDDKTAEVVAAVRVKPETIDKLDAVLQQLRNDAAKKSCPNGV